MYQGFHKNIKMNMKCDRFA